MNNNALVAALGSDAVAAVHGYRLEVVDEARLRGLTLRSVPTGPGPTRSTSASCSPTARPGR